MCPRPSKVRRKKIEPFDLKCFLSEYIISLKREQWWCVGRKRAPGLGGAKGSRSRSQRQMAIAVALTNQTAKKKLEEKEQLMETGAQE
jgi:hypothetical protein